MSDAAEVITVTLGDKTFQAGRRTAAHLEWTIKRLANRHPGTHLHVTQPCFNKGVKASEGTHDFDACLDFQIEGLGGIEGQSFLRWAGWADWWRTPAQGFPFHHHAISLGFARYDITVGKYVDGGWSLFGAKLFTSQVEDYFNHTYGLKGMHTPGMDRTPFPDDIPATIFNYEQWKADMGYADWSAEDKRLFRADVQAELQEALVGIPKEVAKAVWSFTVRTTPILSARAAVRETFEEVTKETP